MEGATKDSQIFWRLVVTRFGDTVSGRHSAPYTIFSGVVSVAAIILAVSLERVPLIWRIVLIALPFVMFLIAGFIYSVYRVWKDEHKKVLSLEASNLELTDRLSPKIRLSIDGDGISEEMDANGLFTKRAQFVVRGIDKAPLINCEALLEQVNRLGDFPETMMEEPLRCEWSNATGQEQFKRTIPDGVSQRANLFAITRSERKILALVEFRKEQLVLGINMPGKYKIAVAITANNSPTTKESFLFEWSDFNNIRLTPWPNADHVPRIG